MLARWLPFESNEASVNTCQAQAHETPARAPTKRAIKKHLRKKMRPTLAFYAFKSFCCFCFHWVIFLNFPLFLTPTLWRAPTIRCKVRAQDAVSARSDSESLSFSGKRTMATTSTVDLTFSHLNRRANRPAWRLSGLLPGR